MNLMYAISLHQPWASALFAPRTAGGPPIKVNETRSWPIPEKIIGEPVAIHATKRDTGQERVFWIQEVQHSARAEVNSRALASIGVSRYSLLPHGCVLGTVVFGRQFRIPGPIGDELEEAWGLYLPGRWAWVTVERKLFSKPIPCTGRQGFFSWEPPHGVEVETAVQHAC